MNVLFESAAGAVLLLMGGDKFRETLITLQEKEETDGAVAPLEDAFAALRELLNRSAREVFLSVEGSAGSSKSVEETAFSMMESLCGENEVESRSLQTREQILEFLDEKIPLDWDPVTGSVPAETASESTVYFVGSWDVFVRSALTCLNQRDNDWPPDAAATGSATQKATVTVDAVHDYQRQRNTDIILRILGVKTVVLDYLPRCNDNDREVTAPWWTLVPCQRVLGSSVRCFLDALCGFFDVDMNSLRNGLVRQWRDRERKAKTSGTFRSIVDYTVERMNIERDSKVHRPPSGTTSRTVTVLTRYCEKFWDMRSPRTLDGITDALSILDTVVSLSASTVIHVAGDLCTILLAFVCDGKVELTSKEKRNEPREDDAGHEDHRLLRTVTSGMLPAEYILSPLDQQEADRPTAESQEGSDRSFPVVPGKAENEKAAPSAATSKLKKQPKEPHRITPEASPSEEDKPDSESGHHSSRTRPIYLLRKSAEHKHYSKVVEKAFKKILSTGKASCVSARKRLNGRADASPASVSVPGERRLSVACPFFALAASQRQITLRLPADIILKLEPKKSEEEMTDTRAPRKSTKERTLDDVRETSAEKTSKLRPPLKKAGRQLPSPADPRGHRQSATRCPEFEDDNEFTSEYDQYLWCRLPSSEDIFGWLDALWSRPAEDETEEEQDGNDSLKEKEVASYCSPGPLFLEELKTSLLEAKVAYLLGESFERVTCQPVSSTVTVLMFIRSLFEPP